MLLDILKMSDIHQNKSHMSFQKNVDMESWKFFFSSDKFVDFSYNKNMNV